MKTTAIASLVMMLMIAPPAHAQSQNAQIFNLNTDITDLSWSKIVTIAACALVGGTISYLIADWLFVETAEATTTLGGSQVTAVSDMAEHSGLTAGLTVAGGIFGAVLGGFEYDRHHADIDNAFLSEKDRAPQPKPRP